MEENFKKPNCKLVGKDSNIFVLMGAASKALIDIGRRDLAEEMTEKITAEAENYSQALSMICEYVNPR